ncbi:MAP3K12-binding inhibitory protein 1-like [Ooceraea biroi]|uniref:MAP3K12-binding inhibitory protein 1-like n=1 Tax=Ooceraea biroi TaxID=2015173 RepID=UPI000F078F8A|nr:MAP3K12-binding inhibitory protein 1-like [Ooceraea biroi]
MFFSDNYLPNSLIGWRWCKLDAAVNMANLITSTTAKEEDAQATLGSNEKISNEIVIDPDSVQVRASWEELNRRIGAFIERKRQQVDTLNVQEFCCHSEKNGDYENSCARVDAVLIRHKDSKSHVKVHRVLNTWGPQTVDQSILKTLANDANDTISCSPILDNRISEAECIVGINKPVPKDIYKRLKNIEDRILYLESISPEYKEFWVADDINNLKGLSKSTQKRTYSMAELDSKLYELEDKYAKKRR